tara:strand:- start:241 stop:441 length:201 start_codon:yes stop_codon:yes gene_type:complete
MCSPELFFSGEFGVCCGWGLLGQGVRGGVVVLLVLLVLMVLMALLPLSLIGNYRDGWPYLAWVSLR